MAVQVFLGLLDLLGVAMIGLLGALSLNGVQARPPGDRVSAFLEFFGLLDETFQTQAAVLGIAASATLILRTLISIILTRKVLFFLSRRGAVVSSELMRKLMSQPLVTIQQNTLYENLYAITSGVSNITLGILGTSVVLIADISLLVIMAIGLFVVDPTMALSTVIFFSTVGFGLYKLMHQKAGQLGKVETDLNIRSNEKITERLDSATLAPYIDKYYFENHQQAFETFQKEFKDNSVAKYVTPEQLNETFWVNLKDPNQAPIIIESFNGLAGVEEVKDQRTYLDQIFSMLNIASLAAISIAGLMLFSAVLLISTTIRLSAVMRRREIGIMRLVGASNFYIQLPFILEGVVAGVIGSLLSGAAIVGIVQFFVQGFLATQLPFTTFVGLGDALALIPGLVLVGAGLAAIAAASSIRRYLRV
jgi:cell division transport system permease protein